MLLMRSVVEAQTGKRFVFEPNQLFIYQCLFSSRSSISLLNSILLSCLQLLLFVLVMITMAIHPPIASAPWTHNTTTGESRSSIRDRILSQENYYYFYYFLLLRLACPRFHQQIVSVISFTAKVCRLLAPFVVGVVARPQFKDFSQKLIKLKEITRIVLYSSIIVPG